MLTIANDTLPQSDLAFLAFRVAFFDTLERIALADQVGQTERCFGFLTEVPFLKSVPPQVQLDALLQTWSRHYDRQRHRGNLVDESVLYAACETTARAVLQDPTGTRRNLRGNPRALTFRLSPELAVAVQSVHLNLPNEGDFLLISQFQDLPPDEAVALKRKFGLNPVAFDPMFDLLGQWHVSRSFCQNAKGLLTPLEIERAAAILRVQPALTK